MKRRCSFVCALVVGMAGVLFLGCEDTTTEPDPTVQYDVMITQPTSLATVTGQLIVRATADPVPDVMQFVFDTFATVIDSSSPFSATFDISGYGLGEYVATVIGYWPDTIDIAEVHFYIGESFDPCDPTIPVVLNGVTIPEAFIRRNAEGCVVTINATNQALNGPNCLDGVESYWETLESLYVSSIDTLNSIDLSPVEALSNLKCFMTYDNDLSSLDISPLANCPDLKLLYITRCGLPSINLSPLASCPKLMGITLDGNEFSSVNLAPLASCDSLYYLYIRNTGLSSVDLSGLSGLSRLSFLFLNGNNLVSIDLSPLEGHDMQEINLGSNQLTTIDLNPIWESTLYYLRLNNNDLTPTACDHVCAYILEHAVAYGGVTYIETDCSCF